MKTRTGFVSNSSSSSFIMIGITRPLTELTEDKKREILVKLKKPIKSDENVDDYFRDAIDQKGLGFFEGEDDGMPEGKFTLGKVLATVDSDGDDLEYTECDMAKMLAIQEEVRELLDVTDQAKIIATTRSC